MSHETRWTADDIARKPESFRARNPHLYAAVGGLVHPERARVSKGRQGQDQGLEGGEKRVGYRVGIVSVRKRLTDAHDHLRSGARPLVDAITASLGFTDDADPRLIWEYGQVLSAGRTGTIVRIERIVI